MIDLATLHALRAVEVQGSVVGAAEALGYTPSAISQQIKRLERQAGLPLLERVGRGVVLTEQGRELVESGTRLLGELERLEADLHRSAGTVSGQVRLAAFSTAMRGLVAPAIGALHDSHPSLAVSLVEHEPWETVDLVATGQFTLGVVHTWGDVALDLPDHLARVSIGADVADVITHRSHRLAGRARITPHDLVDEAWIATPDGTICRQWLRRMYDGTGRQPRIAHEAMEYESHLAMAQAGLGIALVPRLGRARLAPDLVAVDVVDPVPTRDVVAIFRRTMEQSPSVGALLGALHDAAAARG